MTKKTLPNPHARQMIDTYIARAPAFARPMCRKLRALIHKAEPGITEDWKWGPNFSTNGMVCNFGAFKRHVGLAFFNGASLKDPQRLFVREDVPARSMRRINFFSMEDIDEPALMRYVREAVKLNKNRTTSRNRSQALSVPGDLKKKLNKKAKKFFDSLSYTNRKEYVRWIETAKKEETRRARLQKTVKLLLKRTKHP